MLDRVLQWFYWTSIKGQVQRYCASCLEFQLHRTENPDQGVDPFRCGAAGPALPPLWGTPYWRLGPLNGKDTQASQTEVINLKGDTWGTGGGQGMPEGAFV